MNRPGVLFLLLVLFAVCVYPFLFLGQSFSFENGQFDIEIYRRAFHSSLTLKSLKNTLFVCGTTVLLATLLALPLAWLFTRTDVPGKGIWRTTFCLPYAIPPFLGAIAWIYLANPSNGLLLGIFPWVNVYSFTGLIFVMTAFFYTFILINLMAAMEKIDPTLEEAARISGAGAVAVFFKVTLPLVTPSLVSGMLLAFLSAIANFGIAALIGNAAGITLMTTQIVLFQKMASYTGLKLSGILSLSLLVLALGVFILDYQIGKRFRFSLVTGKVARPSLVELGKKKGLVLFFLTLLALVLFVLPVSAILIAALSKVQGSRDLANFGLQNFTNIFFHTDETWRAVKNSLVLALGAGVLCTVFAYFLSQGGKSLSRPLNKVKEIFIAIPYAVPGTVIALAFILTTLSLRLPLYNTLGIILLAYFAKFLNFSYRILNDGISQVDQTLIDAAHVAGAGSFEVFRRIWIPILRPFLMAAFFLVFMPAFSELTMTVLLTGPGNETIGTLIFQMQEYGDASGAGAAVLATFVLLVIVTLNTILKLSTKGKYGL